MCTLLNRVRYYNFEIDYDKVISWSIVKEKCKYEQ